MAIVPTISLYQQEQRMRVMQQRIAIVNNDFKSTKQTGPKPTTSTVPTLNTHITEESKQTMMVSAIRKVDLRTQGGGQSRTTVKPLYAGGTTQNRFVKNILKKGERKTTRTNKTVSFVIGTGTRGQAAREDEYAMDPYGDPEDSRTIEEYESMAGQS